HQCGAYALSTAQYGITHGLVQAARHDIGGDKGLVEGLFDLLNARTQPGLEISAFERGRLRAHASSSLLAPSNGFNMLPCNTLTFSSAASRRCCQMRASSPPR